MATPNEKHDAIITRDINSAMDALKNPPAAMVPKRAPELVEHQQKKIEQTHNQGRLTDY